MATSVEAKPPAKAGARVRSATTPEAELARLDQALEDLAACRTASVSLVQCPSASRERTLARDLAAKARERGFVTAEVSLSDRGFESPEELLRVMLSRLAAPDAERRGLLQVLERYYDEHGEDSATRFGEASEAEGAGGDLTALCRSYLANDDPRARPETRAYRAWLEGREPPPSARNPSVRRALSERTAQRTLAELTRILLALGYRGALFLFTQGDALSYRSERKREKAYTVLREVVDNADESGGAVAARFVVTGQRELFEGARSLQSIPALEMRLAIPSQAIPPPPHRSWVELNAEGESPRLRRSVAPGRRREALANLIRISGGVPPSAGVVDMSVGQERLDRTIRRLFQVVNRTGSFFSVLVGDYGAGKTHHLLHLADRAREDNRPVFWLNLERANLDLGNPAAHLSRLLAASQLPQRGTPSVLTLAARWTRTRSATHKLENALAEIAEGDSESAAAGARKALRVAWAAPDAAHALESYLSGVDLEDRPGDANYRQDAYRRMVLWFELMRKLESSRGPVILIDEAENLYTSGRPPASRRTALRSLSFYCGGALPGACVILALTPPAFDALKKEARALLAEANEMETTLELEDVERFRRSLWGLKPDPVRPLSRREREELGERVRRMHQAVRGRFSMPGWNERVRRLAREHESPRTLIRALVDELESAWWAG